MTSKNQLLYGQSFYYKVTTKYAQFAAQTKMSSGAGNILKVVQSLQNPNRTHYFDTSNVERSISVGVSTEKSLLIYVSFIQVFLFYRP